MQSLRGDCMMTRHQGPIPEPVAQLQQELNQWRSTNRPRTRLPEPFWNAAVELARQYGIYQTANPLRLDYVGLKKRLVGLQNTQRKPRAKRTKAAFVEFVMWPPHNVARLWNSYRAATGAGSSKSRKGADHSSTTTSCTKRPSGFTRATVFNPSDNR